MNYLRKMLFFSRRFQESIIEDFEEKFYKILLDSKYFLDGKNSSIAYMRHVSEEINSTINYYSFENDLKKYLINLDIFIKNYILKLSKSLISFEKKKQILEIKITQKLLD